MKFVFCEGGDDLAVARGVADSIRLEGVRIERYLGKNNLNNFLKAFMTRPEFSQGKVTAIGILRDADEDGNAAFRSVCDALRVNGFNSPERNGGFAINGIRTGVLIVGPKGGQGMIEDLCLNSVSDRPEFPCVDDYFRCITQKSGRKNFTSKAKVRVWMASHSDHEFYVGKAAEEGYWPWESPVFDAMKEFLRQL
jgi:uncharacterized protein DUF3226